MKKKIVILLLLVLLSCLLGGCWSRSEIAEEAIVMGAGADLTEDGLIRLTVQIASPGALGASGGEVSGGGNEPPTWVVWAEGKTIEDAERYLAMKIPRRIYWDHCVILVIGEKLAKEGTDIMSNFFLRNGEPRETMWLMVARGDARDILLAQPMLATTSAQATGFLTRMKTGYTVQIYEYAEMRASKGVQPVITGVEAQDFGESRGSGQGGDSPVQKKAELSGVAVIKNDKLVGWLDAHETRGLLWLKGEARRSAVIVPSPGEPENKVSIRIVRSSTKIVPEYDGENIWFDVSIYAEGDMVEQQSRLDLAKPEQVKALETAMSEEIKSRTVATLEKAQWEYGEDIFGFGNAFHRKYKKEWREMQNHWDEEFSRAGVNISVEAHVRGIGLLTKPAGLS